MTRETAIRAVDPCHGVRGAARSFAQALDVPLPDCAYVNTGIDHCAWFTQFQVQGDHAWERLRRMGLDAWLETPPAQAKADPSLGGLYSLRCGLRLGRQLGALPAINDRHMVEFFPGFLNSLDEVERQGLVRTSIADRRANAERATTRVVQLAAAGMLFPLLYGVTSVLLPRFDPAEVAETIEDRRVTLFLGVPSMYSTLLRLPAEATPKLALLRYCIAGGAAMPQQVMKSFEERFMTPVYEGDGPTECAPVTCVNPVGGLRKPASVGLPVPLVEMRILDDDGAECAHGVVGELCVRGPNVMKGYWSRPDDTAASFFGAWFRTGDLATRDADGYFFIVDRKKDMIIVNGMNVYPRMVEEVLYRHPAVAEAAVGGEPNELHGEIPVAHVVLKEEAPASAAELRAFCRESLGRHQVSRKVFFREALPKNATGKILERELRTQGELERGVDSRTEDA